MRAVETTAPFGRVERLEQASFTPQMEDSQSAARESPPACLGFGYLANSLVQLLETAFKLAAGEPPHAYVVRRRLERACHLMVTSASSLSEIALSVGFSDQAHLCRLFRAAFGQSPATWRREHGNLGRDNPGTNENIT